jgi:8-amino-7-oxononanoate synthase
MATLSKAAGVSGAFVAGHELADRMAAAENAQLHLCDRSTGDVGACSADQLAADRAGECRASSCRPVLPSCAGLQPLLQGKGWRLVPSHTAVQARWWVATMPRSALWRLRRHGLWVPAIRPHCARGHGAAAHRLSALHTEADVNQLLAALQELAG